MISINGREKARLIQAHIAPKKQEQRMKIRFTQSVDCCSQEEILDLFARWLLGEPLSTDNGLPTK
jgi:hypothetical protein